MHYCLSFLLVMAWVCAGPGVLAHQPGLSLLFLQLEGPKLTGQLEVSLADLDAAINLDVDGNGSVTPEEYLERQPAIAAYVGEHLLLQADELDSPVDIREQELAFHQDGVYARIELSAEFSAPPARLLVQSTLFFHFDPQHRGFLQLTHGSEEHLAVFRPGNSAQVFLLHQPAPLLRIRDFVWEGIWHIWIGFDHLLFLLALLLPAVLRRVDGKWEAVSQFKPAFLQVAGIVTAFTAAHSLTLSLAVLGWVHLPERWVEAAIAFSVLLAAANNLHPIFHRRIWLVAFGFGLIHGFGFANVLLNFQLPPASLATALFSFNLGVEAGQLAVIAAFFPLAYAARQTTFYRGPTLTAGSCLILFLATGWMIERLFDWKIFS